MNVSNLLNILTFIGFIQGNNIKQGRKMFSAIVGQQRARCQIISVKLTLGEVVGILQIGLKSAHRSPHVQIGTTAWCRISCRWASFWRERLMIAIHSAHVQVWSASVRRWSPAWIVCPASWRESPLTPTSPTAATPTPPPAATPPATRPRPPLPTAPTTNRTPTSSTKYYRFSPLPQIDILIWTACSAQGHVWNVLKCFRIFCLVWK